MTVFARLVRQFVTELRASSDLPGAAGSTGTLGVLALPGLFAPVMLMPKYSPFMFFLRGQKLPNALFSARVDELMFLCFAFGAAGVTAVLKWESLFLSALDFRNLVHLPVRSNQVLAAKVSSLGLLLAAVFAAVSGPSSVAFPLAVSGGGHIVLSQVVFACGTAALMTVLFTVSAIIALLGVLKLLVPEAWFLTVSRVLRGILMALAVTVILMGPVIADLLVSRGGTLYRKFFPAVWFLGLWDGLVGLTPVDSTMLVRSLGVTGIALVVAGGVYYLTYLRWRSSLPAALAPPKRRAWTDWMLSLALNTLRTPPEERACVRFAARTLWRSEGHWLVFSFWLGLGIALSGIELFAAWDQLGYVTRSAVLLSIPLCLSFTCMWGLRQLFPSAAELPCNWVFSIVPGMRRSAAGKWLLRITALPLTVIAAVAFAPQGGSRFAVIHCLYCACVLFVISDLFCRGYRRIPFSGRVLRLGMNAGQLFAVFAVAFGLSVAIPALIEVWMLRSLWRLVVPLAAACLLAIVKEPDSDLEEITFDSDEDPEIMRLDLSIRGSVFASVLDRRAEE